MSEENKQEVREGLAEGSAAQVLSFDGTIKFRQR